jgi:hypothetical protein
MSSSQNDSPRLREERQFTEVLIGSCIGALLFLLLFILFTLIKSARTPSDITASWFAAWGQWAGGLATATAFVIAACSIRVTGAHARRDRRVAAEIRDNADMAQARQLVIYKVKMPDNASIDAIATFRVENRSSQRFFDVKVPFVDAPKGSGTGIERRTPDRVAAEHRLHEYLPTGESLAPYMNQTQDEIWFTQVTVHTRDWTQLRFGVEYTDAVGLRWRQHYGGQIERVLTSEAIPVRDADRFQPSHQVRVIPDDEKRKMGGIFARDLPPLDDDETLEFLGGPTFLANWKRVERIGQPRAKDYPGPEGGLTLEVSYMAPGAGTPMWDTHLWDKLKHCGFSQYSGTSGGAVVSKSLRCKEDEIPDVVAAFDKAIEYANDEFEANELAAARRSREAAEASAKQTTERQAYLDELTSEFAKPGAAPWQKERRRATGTRSAPLEETGCAPGE